MKINFATHQRDTDRKKKQSAVVAVDSCFAIIARTGNNFVLLHNPVSPQSPRVFLITFGLFCYEYV